MDQSPGQFPPPPSDGPPSGYYSPTPTGQFPLDANRLFSLTFSLYRYRRRLFVAVALAILIPAALVQGAVDLVTSDAFTTLALQMQVMARGGIPEFQDDLIPLMGLSLLASALYGIASYVAQAGITKAAMDTYTGLPNTTASDSLRFGLRKTLTVTAIYLVSIAASFAVIFFAVVLASFAFVAGPGLGLFLGLVIIVSAVAALLFLSVRWALVVPVVVFEGHGALAALGRSWRLVSGSSWRVLGYVIAFGLLLFVIGIAIAFVVSFLLAIVLAVTGSPIGIDTFGPLITLAGAFLIAVLVPIPTIGMMLLYLDLRHRQGEAVPQPGSQQGPGPEHSGPPTF